MASGAAMDSLSYSRALSLSVSPFLALSLVLSLPLSHTHSISLSISLALRFRALPLPSDHTTQTFYPGPWSLRVRHAIPALLRPRSRPTVRADRFQAKREHVITFKDFTCKSGPESGHGYLICAIIARQRFGALLPGKKVDVPRKSVGQSGPLEK